MTTLSPFEDRLLTELKAVVVARTEADAVGVPARSPAVTTHVAAVPGRAPQRRRRAVGLIAVGTAVVGAAAALPVSGLLGQAAPAYAVERTDRGVTLTIKDPTRLAGLAHALTAAGLPATVVPVTPKCNEPDASPPEPPYQIQVGQYGGPDGKLSNWTSVDIIGPPVPAGKTAYLAFTIATVGRVKAVDVYAEISGQRRTCFPPRTLPSAAEGPAPLASTGSGTSIGVDWGSPGGRRR